MSALRGIADLSERLILGVYCLWAQRLSVGDFRTLGLTGPHVQECQISVGCIVKSCQYVIDFDELKSISLGL